jgi:hypothetical protein
VSRHVQVLDGLAPREIPADPVAFLRALAGPSAIRVAGADRSRCRALVTLLHGNEPSGLRAVHGWLRSGVPPATDVLIVLGAVDAALREPVLTKRALPDGSDLNRSFGSAPATEAARSRAQAILDLIVAARPEALVDIHNNTGHNPAYGVAAQVGDEVRQLVGLFADRVVHYDLRVGALLEATVEVCPTVVIEVGRVGDAAADAVAARGVDRLLGEGRVVGPALDVPELDVLHAPVRVEAGAGVTIAVADAAVPHVDLSIAADIDRHNFERLPPGTVIGWIADGAAWPLHARGADGVDRSHELFARRDGRLVTTRPLTPIMITTDPEIARSDCLFYIVE